MNEFTRITVPLSRSEFVALRDMAGSEYRHPREQARYLLRAALGVTNDNISPQQKVNRGAKELEAQRAAATA